MGDDSGYIIDFDALGHALVSRNWHLRTESDSLDGRPDIFARPPDSDRWELIDRDTGEVIAVSAETIPHLSMGALGALLGELLPEDQFLKIVTISPLPPGAGT